MNHVDYFVSTGFLDLLPLARKLVAEGGYAESEMIEAISMTFEKSREYPPLTNRSKWFQVVFVEKLAEARAMLTRHTYVKKQGWRKF